MLFSQGGLEVLVMGVPLEMIFTTNFEERRVIGYSPEQLFAVVAAVDLYEDFLPWCQR
ncbi:hypothetical protein Syun_017260 [Stephania yunnanensis]|uniref:Coenzyme Q-binding protein COQ10 START domain-containing protein n=1 Tax=Stephania yunnanensis TaxID=152371 RepID=A0AAP0J8V1_9MAGN